MKSHISTVNTTQWPFATGSTPSYSSKTTIAKAAAKPARRRWTTAELKTFAELCVKNTSTTQMAAALNRTPKAIINQLGDAEALRTSTGRKLAELVKAELAARTSKSQAQPANHRAPWNAAADNMLLFAFTTGQSPEQIAKTCSRTVASIAGRLHALGLLVFDKDTLTYSTAPKVWYKIKP